MEKSDDKKTVVAGKVLRIGEILVKQGVISEQQLGQALESQKTKKKILGEILLEMGFVTEETLAQALAKEYFLVYVDLSSQVIDHKVVRMFPDTMLKGHHILPFKAEGGHIVIAVQDPLDLGVLQEIERMSGYVAKPVMAMRHQIDAALNKYAAPIDSAQETIKQIIAKKETQTPLEAVIKPQTDADGDINDAPVIKLAASIINGGIEQGASDIHLEPQANGLIVRFRIDGILYERMVVPQDLQNKVISRIKIISGMDIAEKRVPQDGRMSTKSDAGRTYDLRASTLPGIYGEKIVLRILDKESILISLKQLGLDPHESDIFDRLIRRPYGIILITGPTGSGKTTTLYSILNALNEVSRNIVTVEDPVEYELARIHQTSINVRAGYTFGTAIRHILRQDPDVIMVGEIRDLETAEIAIQAAITGHLVLSTLHTNSAAGAITRLLDMNVEPFLISSAVIGVIAQRLVRRLCPVCREDYEASDDVKMMVGEFISDSAKPDKLILAKPKGCDKCKHLGYSKRIGIFEMLEMTDELRALILKHSDESELTKVAISQGMRTLRGSGVKKILEKTTSLEEAMRVVFVEDK